MQDADFVVTGEGRIDSQTARGKAPAGVAEIARRHGVPVLALGGAVSDEDEGIRQSGIAAVFAAVRAPCRIEDALSNAAQNLQESAANVAAAIRIGMQLR